MQIERLNEAMLVAYGAMSGGNLQAVDRVVKITREFDRYHGFARSLAAPAARPRPAAKRRGDAKRGRKRLKSLGGCAKMALNGDKRR
jgi:hypothetical protein